MNVPNPAIIDGLQASVAAHLTAIEQYRSQAAHFARWGYTKLAEAARGDAEEETGHLHRLLTRLEGFDVAPQSDHPTPLWPRHDYVGILAANLELEERAAAVERAGVLTARTYGDEMTAKVFSQNLHDSEASIVDIEATQKVIAQVGAENFLANQA